MLEGDDDWISYWSPSPGRAQKRRSGIITASRASKPQPARSLYICAASQKCQSFQIQMTHAATPKTIAATAPICPGKVSAAPAVGDAVAAEADAEADLEAALVALADDAEEADEAEAEAEALIVQLVEAFL